MFKKKCRCGKTEKQFKIDIGPFFINECCRMEGYDIYGNKGETAGVAEKKADAANEAEKAKLTAQEVAKKKREDDAKAKQEEKAKKQAEAKAKKEAAADKKKAAAEAKKAKEEQAKKDAEEAK